MKFEPNSNQNKHLLRVLLKFDVGMFVQNVCVKEKKIVRERISEKERFQMISNAHKTWNRDRKV